MSKKRKDDAAWTKELVRKLNAGFDALDRMKYHARKSDEILDRYIASGRNDD